MILLRLLFAALAAALVLAAPVGAATPFTLGPGSRADVAVSDDGTGHFVWSANGIDNPVIYCRVPRGKTACADTKTFALPKTASGRTQYVFASGANVTIYAHRCCEAETYVIASTDGGATFAAPVLVGRGVTPNGGLVQGPPGSISMLDVADFASLPLAGPPPAKEATLPTGFSIPTFGALGLLGGATPIAVFSDGANESFSRWSGAGDLNDPGSWVGPTPLSPVGNEPSLAGGPAGLVLLHTVGTPGKNQLQARRFDGTAFGPSVPVSEKADPIAAHITDRPAGGRFYAVWNDNRDDTLTFTTSSDGTAWGAPSPLVRGENHFASRIAAAPDGQGFAVWDDDSRTSVRAAPLEELDTPDANDDKPVGPESSSKVTADDQEITFFTPKQCVNPGGKVRVRVTSKTKKKIAKGKGRSKILLVDFLMDAKLGFTDKKKAFRTKLSTKGLAPGTKHTAKARVQLQQLTGKKKKFKKTLTAQISIC